VERIVRDRCDKNDALLIWIVISSIEKRREKVRKRRLIARLAGFIPTMPAQDDAT
jgi:hypothetical protein